MATVAAHARAGGHHHPVRVLVGVAGVVGQAVNVPPDLMDVGPQGLAYEGHLVGEGDVDVPVRVLRQFGDLGGEAVGLVDGGLHDSPVQLGPLAGASGR